MTQPDRSDRSQNFTTPDPTQLYRGGHGLIRSMYYGTNSIGAVRDNPDFFVNPTESGASTVYLNPTPSFQEVVMTP